MGHAAAGVHLLTNQAGSAGGVFPNPQGTRCPTDVPGAGPVSNRKPEGYTPSGSGCGTDRARTPLLGRMQCTAEEMRATPEAAPKTREVGGSNSGQGRATPVPLEIQVWSWVDFLMSWLCAIPHTA